MADVNEMFNNITKEQSFYTKSDKKKKSFTPFAKGEYFGHIIECESKIVDVSSGSYKARLYTYVFQASEENKNKDFTYINIKGLPEITKGDCYAGSKFRGKLWRFLEPSKDDTFQSNSDGNNGYLRFCENLGIECPSEKREINGEEVEVKILPEISPEDVLGKPAIAFVDLGRPFTNKKGEKKQYWDAKFLKKWEDGKEITIAGGDDAIPF
tara:strand:+ start:701 stop:1333 length:633 start_codon:yes stop_codon:yes gene_type:complete